jgi:hypothetical protein
MDETDNKNFIFWLGTALFHIVSLYQYVVETISLIIITLLDNYLDNDHLLKKEGI